MSRMHTWDPGAQQRVKPAPSRSGSFAHSSNCVPPHVPVRVHVPLPVRVSVPVAVSWGNLVHQGEPLPCSAAFLNKKKSLDSQDGALLSNTS